MNSATGCEATRPAATVFVRKPLEFSEFAQPVAQLGIYWVAANQIV